MKSSKTQTLLLVISFLEGAAVMGVELIGAKMIAPYFGTSIYVWSTVLGITLIGLTSGYFLGGLLSYKKPSKNTFFILLGIAGLLTALMPVTSTWIMNLLLDFNFKISVLISAMLFIFPPLMFYGMISPYIIKFLLEKMQDLFMPFPQWEVH